MDDDFSAPATGDGGGLFNEPNQTSNKKPKKQRACDVPLPDSLNTPQFKQRWLDWLVYLQVKKKAINAITAKLQLQQMEPWGEKKADHALWRSMKAGWSDIYEPKDFKSGGGGTKTTDYDAARQKQREREADEQRRLAEQDRQRFAALAKLPHDMLTILHARVVEHCADPFLRGRLARSDPLTDRMLATLIYNEITGGGT